MSWRVNQITVTLNLFVEFEGAPRDITFAYAPADGDPLVALALATNEQRNLDAALAESKAGGQAFDIVG